MTGKYVSSPPPLLQTAEGDLTENPQQTSKIFAESFASFSKTENYSTKFPRYKQSYERIHINFDTNHFLKYNQ